jgi:hypothetical protein
MRLLVPKRTLTDDEQKDFAAEKLKEETHAYKGYQITVEVKPETDDDGLPQFIVTRVKNKDFNA